MTGKSLFDSSIARSTSRVHSLDLTASGETTNTTVSDCAIKPPRRASQSSPAAMSWRSRNGAKPPYSRLATSSSANSAESLRIRDEDLELLSCASVGHGLPGSRPESRTHGIGHMCRSSATAEFDRRDQVLRTGSNHSSDLLPKGGLRLCFDGPLLTRALAFVPVERLFRSCVWLFATLRDEAN